MRYGMKTTPIRNRDFGKVGVSLKLPIHTNDILRVLSFRYGGLPKAYLMESLVVEWVNKMSEKLGEDVLERWAADMRELMKEAPYGRLEDIEDCLMMSAGMHREPSVEEEALGDTYEAHEATED